jgi:hypothetical protein
VVFDDQFNSIQRPAHTISEDFYRELFQKALWEYKSDADATLEDFYPFDAYWTSPPVSKHTKRQRRQDMTDHKTFSATVACKDTLLSCSPSNSSVSINSSEGDSPIRLSTPDKLLKASTTGPIKSIKNQKHPSNLKTQTLNLKSNSRENTKADTIKLNLVPTACHSLSFIKWKRKHGISAHVHNVQNPSAATSLLPEDILPFQNDSIDLQHLSYAHIAASAVAESAHMLASNNDDILTQIQILKTSDKEHFIMSQKGEIEGLLKFDVMDIHPIASLPRSAKLLSSIWSYHQKRSPNGD